MLTEYIILDLGRRHQDSTNLLNIESIQDSIERTLVDNGHYRTARAFITYRNERARRRLMKGEKAYPSMIDLGGGSLAEASVATSSGETIQWDREKIVKALVKETNLAYEEARQVSRAVEMEIVHSKISHLTAPLIRELTNAKLLQLGYENERRMHARLGLPVFDVEQRLFGTGCNGRKQSIETEILRQFALEKVMPADVTEAHGIQDIHIHDLELVHRPAEIHRHLDFDPARTWPFLERNSERRNNHCEWSDFLNQWEREESQLLNVAGRRLVWENVNSAIAFHATGSSIETKRAVSDSLAKLWRLAGSEEGQPTVVWRLPEKVDSHWRGKFIGARQLSLLPEDDVEMGSRATLYEILRQVAEEGPRWAACGVEFEVIVEASSGKRVEPNLAEAIGTCMSKHAPVSLLFQRETAVSKSRESNRAPLMQTVSLNFPKAAVLSEGEEGRLVEWLEDKLNLAVKAHSAKRDLLERRLAGGALSPTSSHNRDCEGNQPLNLEEAVWGIGVWGLLPMTTLARGDSPATNDETIKWLLGIIARLKLRMDEIGNREGLKLELVTSADEEVTARFSESMIAAGASGDWAAENLVPSGSPRKYETDGKLHPFFGAERARYSVEMDGFSEVGDLVEEIQEVACSTHVGGFTWAGVSYHCLACGNAFGETHPVCEACGSELVAKVSRGSHGTMSKLVRP